jgi:hypothetical protein
LSDLGRHTEWLSLVDVSGPFLAEPVLKDAFPQGLEGLDSAKRTLVRQAYDEWREALDLDDPAFPRIHRSWIDLILKRVLELDESGAGDILKAADKLPHEVRCELPEHDITICPDYVLMGNQPDARPLILIAVYSSEISLTDALRSDGWNASPAERMVELCRSTEVRLGLVTNGEQWMLVDAPIGAVTTFASWYARLWGQEPVTLQAFVNLLGVRRFFVDRSQQLPALLDGSLKFQDEVTDALGEQVRRAVEVLIQALDRADVDRDRELLDGIEPTELYEAGLTVMMRIVFLLSAEERELLLLGDERYEANYAVSTLRMQLRSESEEILERRWDAWSRLLAIFRAVFGGVDHEAMRLPALGGSLFDPDRFPFLEGRKRRSHWKIDPATPLPIDNRTVLYLLDAVQLFQGRTLSYLALDIEQIGYVYEGLLERTVIRANEATLDLDATKNAENPWVSLPELDDAAANGRSAVEELLKNRTGSSANRIRNDLDKTVDESSADKLLTACHGNRSLRDRISPYFFLLRTDRWGYPIVYPKGAFMVTSGVDRRETGTHYTPKSFTEAIVKETLEPLVYVGPATGEPRENWKLNPPAELLDLKICDPAMGSGAFLVQVCRWLSERLVESWARAESDGSSITSEGEVVDAIGSREPLRKDGEERRLVARRLIAERCLYGTDMNPLAVELAKLSIWLVTLAKGRPFGFLDHSLRCGDSLLGITSLEQLDYLEMRPGKGSTKKLFASKIDQAVSEAIAIRSDLRRQPIRDIRDVEIMARLDEEARRKLEMPELVADVLIGEVLEAGGREIDLTALAIDIGGALAGDKGASVDLSHRAKERLNKELPAGNRVRRPFHWPLEFPEVFCRDNAGFDAFVGNPPFLGGQRISGTFGSRYKEYLAHSLSLDHAATADLVVFFFLRVFGLVRDGGYLGLLARRSLAEGKNREVGLEQILSRGATIFAAHTNKAWPGKASVIVHQIHMTKAKWRGVVTLNNSTTNFISAYLDDMELATPKELKQNTGRMFQGVILNNEGFKIDEREARALLSTDEMYKDVVFPFIGGNEINSNADNRPACWVINFWDWSETKAREYTAAFEKIERRARPSDGGGSPVRQNWWRLLRPRPELHHAIGRGRYFSKHPKGWRGDGHELERVIVISRGVTKYPAFTFLPNSFLFSEKLYVIADERRSLFCILSSDIHAVWAWSQKTSMGGDLFSLSYTNGDIFETFALPASVLSNADDELELLGEEFFNARQKCMESTNSGLTKLYNDFHDPAVNSAAFIQLRKLQQQISIAVCQRYGWENIDMVCGFHAVGYLPDGSNTRFTISETARLEVLRRLSKLNKTRVDQQTQPGETVGGAATLGHDLVARGSKA